MLQAGAGLSIDELANPFVCLRKTGITTTAQDALSNISDRYLLGVGLCLAGKGEAGLAALKEGGDHSNAEVQYAAGLSEVDPQAGVKVLTELRMHSSDLAIVLLKLSDQPGVDPYPALRILAQQANNQSETWNLWLQGFSRLEMAKKWQAALDWLDEGLVIAPPEVQSSLHLRRGIIYQTRSDSPDYYTALTYYNRALEEDGWLTNADEANAHIWRGMVYGALKDEYGPNMALAEYQIALMLQPGSYWAFIDIGQLYLYDLKDINRAESYFRQALEADDSSSTAYVFIGDVYKVRGDKETAIEWYRQALERQPNWQPAMDRLQELEGK